MRFWFTYCVALISCVPSSEIVPLRGEDPQVISVAAGKKDYLEKGGAVRTFEEMRHLILQKKYKDVLRYLGPATINLLYRSARQLNKPPESLIQSGHIEGIGLPEEPAPFRFLAAEGQIKVVEEGGFDPSRKRTYLVVSDEWGKRVRFFGLFTNTGWQFEMVRILDIPNL